MVFSTVLLFLSESAKIIWSLPFLLFIVTRFTLNIVTDEGAVTKLQKELKDCSSMVINGKKALGFFMGWRYFGYISETAKPRGGSSLKIYLFCSAHQYKLLTTSESEQHITTSQHKSVVILQQGCSHFWESRYNERKIALKGDPNPFQAYSMEKILPIYREKQRCVTVLYGYPGIGKTMLGLLLAHEIGAKCCLDWNPTTPGATFENMYKNAGPNEKEPLVVVLDEFDIILNQIHMHSVERHKNLRIQTSDKTSWNSLWDKYDLGLWSHTIVLMTTNKSQVDLDSLDPSYLRPGRVDFRIDHGEYRDMVSG